MTVARATGTTGTLRMAFNFRNSVRPSLPAAFIALVIAVGSGGNAHAQIDASQQLDRERLLRTQPDLRQGQDAASNADSQGFAAESPGGRDLGEQQILKRRAEYEPFTISAGAPFYYTTNVALVRRGEQDDFLIAPQITATYAPQITATLFGEVTVRQQLFYYERFRGLNFASFDAGAGLFYYIPQAGNLTFRARYNFNRLTDTDHFDEFYTNHTLFFDVEKPFRFSRAQQLVIGADAEVSVYANSGRPERNEYGLYAGYAVALSRSFSANAGARFAVRDYHFGNRVDVTEILSLGVNYRIARWLSLSAISSFAANQSNESVFDYTVFNIGGAVALTISF